MGDTDGLRVIHDKREWIVCIYVCVSDAVTVSVSVVAGVVDSHSCVWVWRFSLPGV